ncbi:hypothetical protein DIW83_15625 [Acinetobacter nosocomialis]|nr:hypothetical protein DIW83_15625 [Acinetobacter nosocomialis]
MTYIYKNPAGMTDSEKTEHIKKVVTAEGVALRKRHPILNHQNAIGAMILFISLVGMIATAVLYINQLGLQFQLLLFLHRSPMS